MSNRHNLVGPEPNTATDPASMDDDALRDPEARGTAPTDAERFVEFEYEFRCSQVRLGLAEAFVPIPIGSEDRFEIHDFLGRGSMGSVYRAYDRLLDRDVAIKIVSAHSLDHARLRERLQREARALAQVRHENVLVVHDVGHTNNGELFVATDYIPGLTLDAWQRDRPLSDVLYAYLQAAKGLAAVHRQGIVHRDFKPQNVLVHERRVVIGDFGLAGSVRASRDGQAAMHTSVPPVRSSGVGTAAYMPPEQQHGTAEPRSDQYALCVALWEAVAGTRPFTGPRGVDEAMPECPADMPEWLYCMLSRGLAHRPAERHPTVDVIVTHLQWFVEHEHIDSVSLAQLQHDIEPSAIVAIYRSVAVALVRAHERAQMCAFDVRRVFVATANSSVRVGISPAPPDLDLDSDPASDQRAFCAAYWQALVGSAAPQDSPRLRPRRLPRWLYGVLRRGLAAAPERRFTSMAALLEQLDRRSTLRRVWPLSFGAVALASGALGLWLLQPQPCSTAGAPIEAVWNSARHAELEQLLLSSGTPAAEITARLSLGALDHSARRWGEQAGEICLAREQGRSSAELEARAACLQRRLGLIEDYVGQLRELDHETLVQLPRWLEPLRSSDDVCRFPPPVLDSEVRDALDASRDAESRAALDDSMTWAERAREHAAKVTGGCESTRQLDVSHELGYAEFRLGYLQSASQPEAALASLAEAGHHALACDDKQLYADVQLQTAALLALKVERSDDAAHSLANADAMLGRLPDVGRLRQAERERVAAQVAHARGDYEAAHASYERSLAVLDGRYFDRAAKIHQNIATTYLAQGKYEDAEASLRRSGELVVETLGVEHPAALAREARLALGFGQIARVQGRLDEAHVQYLRASESDEPEVEVRALSMLAELHKDDPTRAEVYGEKLVTAIDAHPGLPERMRAEALFFSGTAFVEANNAAGIDLLERSCALWHGRDTTSSLSCEINLAIGYANLGSLEEANDILQRLRQSPQLEENSTLRGAAESLENQLESLAAER